KPADRTAPRRQAAANEREQQPDPNAVPALSFLALPQSAAKAVEAEAQLQSGSEKQPQSAADSQLNAAIAAAGAKTGAPATEISDKSAAPVKSTTPLEASLPSAAQLASQAGSANAAPARPSALASKDAGSGEYTPLTPNPQQQISLTAASNAAGQQTTPDDSHTGKHDKLEKLGRQDSPAVAKSAAEQANVASSTSVNEAATSKANAGQQNLDIATQLNPALAHGQAAVAATAASPTPPAPVKLVLPPPVGSDGWGTALGKQVVWMGNTSNQSAELHLNPPDLGPLKVTLTINDNQAQAMFVSAHQSVRTALEAALPQLRNSLAENGINLGNTSVSADTQQQQQQSAFAQNQSGNRGSGNHFQLGAAVNGLSAKVEPSAVAAAAASRNGNGKVDIFA
ncbi:flagellar hook-length control protein FliK, partial [Collimonas silvisoli]|uniref:flagellar hook-length control protein FliK n=1 Tax=Collimonas silvisoli TaxID=2825884 RepID=UPI001B8C4A60